MTKKRRAGDDLQRLAETFVDEMLDLPDSEILEAAAEQHKNPAKEAERIRALLTQAAVSHGKRKMAAAKERAAAASATAKSNVVPMTLTEKRARLERIIKQNPTLTMAARQRRVGSWTEAEIDEYLADLEALSIKDKPEHQ